MKDLIQIEVHKCSYHGRYESTSPASCPICEDVEDEKNAAWNWAVKVADEDELDWFACGLCGSPLTIDFGAQYVAVCSICGATHHPELHNETLIYVPTVSRALYTLFVKHPKLVMATIDRRLLDGD